MNFEEVLFFVCDGSRCMEEADDPADSLLLFHPSDMTVESKCTWSSQLLGLHRFWQSAVKKIVSSFSIGRYHIVCQEVDHRFLTVFGWPKLEGASDDLQVEALQQNLQRINHLLLSFVSSFAALAKLPPSHRQDLLLAIFSLCPFTWADFSHARSHLNLFQDVGYLRTMASSIHHKCTIVAPKLSVLAALLAFRTDVLQDDIPLSIQQYRRQFLTAALRRESDILFLGDKDTTCPTASKQKLYRLYIPTDDYHIFRLARHQTAAIRTIGTLSASPGHASFQNKGCYTLPHHALKMPKEEVGRAGLLLYVLQHGGMSLIILLDQSVLEETLTDSLLLLAGSMEPLLNAIEDSAIERILQSQWERNAEISQGKVTQSQKKCFHLDKACGMFDVMPDDELDREIINEAQLLLLHRNLQSCSITKRGITCTAETDGNNQRFFLEKKKSS
ncbi:hypothetical protein RvY_15011-2 [Ramazzottius varieornatus]|uniref:CCZ1/INTU/HSP4 first Longin domain-containing protein n=1 Tax=Ramazzottius varieornatus TaxID=947166 RepID=A0A1D1VTC2_RAMVA|nr:hypothetical protein RvY_15011-2 [Ramazzottius varieornatus]